VLNAAGSALQNGDLAGAGALYERVVNTPPTGETAQQTTAINDFARFQATVSLLATGHEDQAKAQLDALQKADPNSAFARLDAQLWDQYSMVGSVRGACSQLQPQIAAQAGPSLQALQALGVSVNAQALCKIP
jgi:outer membrane protein assembly factor BamD (BamD/ComL family)